MTCQQVAEFLADYLDRSLPWQQRAAFRLHLLLCRDCRRYLDSYQKTRGLIGSLRESTSPQREGPVPEELVQAILASRVRDANQDAP
jgi:anti-sigma factor RsiW